MSTPAPVVARLPVSRPFLAFGGIAGGALATAGASLLWIENPGGWMLLGVGLSVVAVGFAAGQSQALSIGDEVVWTRWFSVRRWPRSELVRTEQREAHERRGDGSVLKEAWVYKVVMKDGTRIAFSSQWDGGPELAAVL